MISKKLQQEEAQESFPEFILLLRDVPRVKVNGRVVEPKEYLENILESALPDDNQFSPKWCVREYCKKRTCFILTQPTEFEDLSELGQHDHPKLRPRFVEDLDKLKGHLFGNSDVKRLNNGSPYTTKAFCEYTRALVASVEGGVIPNVSNLQHRIAEDENQRVWKETTEVFRTSIRDDENPNVYGSPTERFKVLQKEGIERLQNETIPKSQKHMFEVIEQFKLFSEEEYKKWSKQMCRKFLTCHLETYFNKVENNFYNAPNAKDKFERDVGEVKEQYDKMENFGPEKVNVWNEKEREIRNRTKELDLVDLRFQLNSAEIVNKEEKKRLDQTIKRVEAEVHEQKLVMARKEQEHKHDQMIKETALEKERRRFSSELERKESEMQNLKEILEKQKADFQRAKDGMRTRTNQMQTQIDRYRDEQRKTAIIDGVSRLGAAFFSSLNR